MNKVWEMNMIKSKRAIMNMLASFLSKLVMGVFAIILPKLIIEYFGSETNGLLSSLASIYVYLSLLEAGVGGASIQVLYKNIIVKDYNKINGVLSATKNYYKKTGMYFLACISFLAFVYPLVIKSNLNYFTVVAIILLSSGTFIINYFFQGKYNVLLSADNRGYVIILFKTAFSTLSSIGSIVFVVMGYNIIVVQSVNIVVNIIQNIVVHQYIIKTYKEVNWSCAPDYEAISQKKSVLVHEVATVVFNSTDILILTIFCDLKIVSVYVVYNMIYSLLGSVPVVITIGITGGMGHLYNENMDRFKRIFNCYEAYYQNFVFVVYIVAYLLTIPFLRMYSKDFMDINYIDLRLPILFVSVSLLSNLRSPSVMLISIAGHFEKTQWRAIIETLINLTISIILVNIIGIYGVLCGTIVALLYRSFDIVIYASRNLLQRSSFIAIGRWVYNLLISSLVLIIYRLLDIKINNYLQLFFTGVLLVVTMGIVYVGITSIIEKKARMVLFEYLIILKNKLFKKSNITKES